MIAWSAAVLTGFAVLIAVLTLILAIGAFFGFRSFRSIRVDMRKMQRRMSHRLAEIEQLHASWQERVNTVDESLNRYVEAAYTLNRGNSGMRTETI